MWQSTRPGRTVYPGRSKTAWTLRGGVGSRDHAGDALTLHDHCLVGKQLTGVNIQQEFRRNNSPGRMRHAATLGHY